MDEASKNYFEELIVQELLVEMFNKKKAEVFENVVFQGTRRYYVEDLSERDFSLENTTPYQIEILGHVVSDNAWGNMLQKTMALLLNLFPEYNDKMLEFRCEWTKAVMFYAEKKGNCKCIKEGLYINCNHTALHSCWLLQDLLDYFNIDKQSVHFLIHRPSSAEPKKIQEYVENRFKNNFLEYLKNTCNKSEEAANKVILRIEKYLNPRLVKMSKSYPNLFLFDDYATVYNYIKKVNENVQWSLKLNEKAKKVLSNDLTLLLQFYKTN